MRRGDPHYARISFSERVAAVPLSRFLAFPPTSLVTQKFDLLPSFDEGFFEAIQALPGERFVDRFSKVALKRAQGAALEPPARVSLLASNYRVLIVRPVLPSLCSCFFFCS